MVASQTCDLLAKSKRAQKLLLQTRKLQRLFLVATIGQEGQSMRQLLLTWI